MVVCGETPGEPGAMWFGFSFVSGLRYSPRGLGGSDLGTQVRSRWRSGWLLV